MKSVLVSSEDSPSLEAPVAHKIGSRSTIMTFFALTSTTRLACSSTVLTIRHSLAESKLYFSKETRQLHGSSTVDGVHL